MSFGYQKRRPLTEEEKSSDVAKARARALETLAAQEVSSGQLYERLCRRFTEQAAAEVDGNVCVSSEEPLYPGEFYDILVEDSDLYDLYGTVVK